MKLASFATAATSAVLLATSASAITLDFDLSEIDVITANPILVDNADEFSQTAGGVTFTFSNGNPLRGFFFVLEDGETSDVALRLGGGGGSATSFNFTVDRDVLLTGYATGDAFGYLNAPTFDVEDGELTLTAGNPLGPRDTDYALDGGGITLVSGTNYLFNMNDTGFAVQTFLDSLSFDLIGAPPYTDVPAPGALGLLGLGILGIGMARRRKG
ncbi:MAG: PEP-CTERM sorting domain-containing protein [Pacificimonas sp.]